MKSGSPQTKRGRLSRAERRERRRREGRPRLTDAQGRALAHLDEFDYRTPAERQAIRRAQKYEAKQAKKRKAQEGGTPVGKELAMLDWGKPTQLILKSAFGEGPKGRLWQGIVLHGITHAKIKTRTIEPVPQRKANHPVARVLLRLILRLCDRCVRHGGEKISVIGQKAWWGQEHKLVPIKEAMEAPPTRKEFHADCVKLMKHEARAAAGLPVDNAQAPTMARVYVPKPEQGGLAKSIDRTARSICTYAVIIELMGLFTCTQPDRDAPDAVLPRKGQSDWAYPEWTVLSPGLPERLLERLIKHWKKAAFDARPKARWETDEPKRLPSKKRGFPPTGPPEPRPESSRPVEEQLTDEERRELDELDQRHKSPPTTR